MLVSLPSKSSLSLCLMCTYSRFRSRIQSMGRDDFIWERSNCMNVPNALNAPQASGTRHRNNGIAAAAGTERLRASGWAAASYRLKIAVTERPAR